ncbi:MAG: metal ABC transporter ATP-binding protein [Anaerolineales bacterium]|nr:metal ABC transporter ATP-binding protein [Anaerolineales bacterium]
MELTQSSSVLHLGSQSDKHDHSYPVLKLKNISVHFNNTVALRDVSFELQVGERVAVIGPNGAGKSTLFNVISGVLVPSQGQVDIYGHVPGEHICIAYVSQRSQVDWQFPANVADVVMMGRIGRMGLFRWPKRADWQVVEEALDLVGMNHLRQRQIGELSGGQQQRVFIARALAQEAELMLMDEPLSGLDVKSQEDIFAILDKLRQRRVTVLVATHDLNLAAERFDRLMLLNQTLLGFGQADQVFTPKLLSQAYSGSMRLIETPNGTMFLSDGHCCGGEEHTHA